MNKILIGIAIVAIIGIGILFINRKKPSSQTMQPSNTNESNNAVGSTSETAATYTLDDISQHKNADSCWMAIEGKVYDVTPFIKSGQHPGGAQILQGCGIDATELFNNRPGNEGPHSINARDMLKDYYIGDFK